MPDSPSEIIVTGLGQVGVTPDRVQVHLGVNVQADRPADALAEASELGGRLIEVLDDAGIPPTERQTSQLSLQPRYGPTPGAVTGHHASYIFTVTLTDLNTATAIIARAADTLGENLAIHYLGWLIKDRAEPLAQARRIAVDDAIEKARQIAGAAGVTLGKVRSIVEASPFDGQPMVHFAGAGFAAPAARPPMPPPPLEAGQSQVATAVTATFEIESQ
jgi:uncharacterized protein YggE